MSLGRTSWICKFVFHLGSFSLFLKIIFQHFALLLSFWLYPSVEFSEFLACCLGTHPHLYTPRVSPGFIDRDLTGSFSRVPTSSWFPGAFLNLPCWGISCNCIHSAGPPVGEGDQKLNRFSVSSLGTVDLLIRGGSSHPLRVAGACLRPPLLWPLLEAGTWEN